MDASADAVQVVGRIRELKGSAFQSKISHSLALELIPIINIVNNKEIEKIFRRNTKWQYQQVREQRFLKPIVLMM